MQQLAGSAHGVESEQDQPVERRIQPARPVGAVRRLAADGGNILRKRIDVDVPPVEMLVVNDDLIRPALVQPFDQREQVGHEHALPEAELRKRRIGLLITHDTGNTLDVTTDHVFFHDAPHIIRPICRFSGK
ncbi:hypothetical protein SDC9_144607 [bioreactor metagenome]|uniref:Uncharacterized protein n=1 Tax=bioreactor metagenome TaxID=1076179 RepID=A0A645E6I2_9ZZZZ